MTITSQIHITTLRSTLTVFGYVCKNPKLCDGVNVDKPSGARVDVHSNPVGLGWTSTLTPFSMFVGK